MNNIIIRILALACLSRMESAFAVDICPGQDSYFPEIVFDPLRFWQRDVEDIAVHDSGFFVASVQVNIPVQDRLEGKAYLFDVCGRLAKEITIRDVSAPVVSSVKVPMVHFGSDGGFVIAWHAYDAYCLQAFDKSGTATGDPQIVSGEGFGGVNPEPIIAQQRNGNYILAWTDGSSYFVMRDVGSGQEKRMTQEYYPEDLRTGVAGHVNGLVCGPNRIAVLTIKQNKSTHACDLVVWLLDDSLNLIGSPIFVANDAYQPNGRAIGMNAKGEFVVAWENMGRNWWRLRNDPEYEKPMDRILAQRFGLDGERIGPELAVTGDPIPGAHFYSISLGMNDEGDYIITWPTLGGSLFGQRYDNYDQKVGHNFQINVSGGTDEMEFPVSLNSHGRISTGYYLGTDRRLQKLCVRVFDLDATDFIRGDADGNGVLRLKDAVSIVEYLFRDRKIISTFNAYDVNDDEKVDLSDAVNLLSYLFLGSPSRLPHPFPYWGFDPTR